MVLYGCKTWSPIQEKNVRRVFEKTEARKNLEMLEKKKKENGEIYVMKD
jgi:hypothetical protein